MSQRVFDSAQLVNEAISQSKIGPLRKKLLRSVMANRPDIRAELMASVMDQCKEDCMALGISMPVEGQMIEAVDWQKLIELFIKYLPTLIQLILLIL